MEVMEVIIYSIGILAGIAAPFLPYFCEEEEK